MTPEAAEPLAPFAASAVEAGDRRWKGLAGTEGPDARPGKGVAEARLTHPTAAAYRATRRGAWGQLLGGVPSAWGFWSERYAALLDVAAWGERAEAGGWTETVAASKARDLAERHARAFRQWAPEVRLRGARGEAALPASEATLVALVEGADA